MGRAWADISREWAHRQPLLSLPPRHPAAGRDPCRQRSPKVRYSMGSEPTNPCPPACGMGPALRRGDGSNRVGLGRISPENRRIDSRYCLACSVIPPPGGNHAASGRQRLGAPKVLNRQDHAPGVRNGPPFACLRKNRRPRDGKKRSAASIVPGDGTLRLHSRQQTRWHALYRRYLKHPTSALGASGWARGVHPTL